MAVRWRIACCLPLVAMLVAAGCGGRSSHVPAATQPLRLRPLAAVAADGSPMRGDTGPVADPAGDGRASCPAGTAIGVLAALSGPDSAIGDNVLGGVNLAAQRHNQANPGCRVTVTRFDTRGDPRRAARAAALAIGDRSVLAVVGPTFSAEARAIGAAPSEAGLVTVSPSASNPTLTTRGWSTFFRGLADDALQGPAVAGYLARVLHARAVCVLGDDTDYGATLARSVRAALGSAADPRCAAQVKAGAGDVDAAVAAVVAARPDAVFYAGYAAEAAPLARGLVSRGVRARFVGGDGVDDPMFVADAGGAATGALLSCPCGPAPDWFAASYARVNDEAPGVYSVEAYDLATVLIRGIDAGRRTRAALLAFVRGYDGLGVARRYRWRPDGELADPTIWLSTVTGRDVGK
jgi:branched-chain amino acid transport system substrate-binding protein